MGLLVPHPGTNNKQAVMKLTIVRTDKKKVQHLTVKSVEWFLERIKTDTKAEDIGKMREYIARFGDNGLYEQNRKSSQNGI